MPLARGLAAMFARMGAARGGASRVLRKASGLRKTKIPKSVASHPKIWTPDPLMQEAISKFKSKRMSMDSARAVQKFQSIDPNKLRSVAKGTVRRTKKRVAVGAAAVGGGYGATEYRSNKRQKRAVRRAR
jgi:hypothetical protein